MSGIRLRPVERDDLGWLADMVSDRELVGAHNWSGPVDREALVTKMLSQFEADGMLSQTTGRLVVEFDGQPIGDVAWRTEWWGPSPQSACPAIGIALLPAHRGRGHGTEAQRQLVDYLFEHFDINRVQSDTAADNPAEQKALERAGFVREGVVRDGEFRDGAYHDHVLYSVLRREWRPDGAAVSSGSSRA